MYPDEPNIGLIEEVLKKISFSNFPMPIKLRVYNRSVLHITIQCNDRASGNPIFLEGRRQVPPWFQRPSDFSVIFRWIFEEVISLIKHEMAECMLWDGHRILDPHKAIEERPAFAPQEALAELFKGMDTPLKGTGQGKQP